MSQSLPPVHSKSPIYPLGCPSPEPTRPATTTGSFLPSLGTLPKTREFKPKVVRGELESLGMNSSREMARLTRQAQADLSRILTAEEKREVLEQQARRTREFERMRAAQDVPGYGRREQNRQMNGVHQKANKAAFETHLAAVRQRREEKERKAAEAKAAMEAEREERASEKADAEAARAEEIEYIQKNGPEGVVVSAYQLSARARDNLNTTMQETDRTLEARRQQHFDELSKSNQQKRELRESKTNAINEKKRQMEEAKMRDSAAGERALLERLANMRAAHEVRVEQQRKADAEKLDQVMARAQVRMTQRLDSTRSDAQARAERSQTAMRKHRTKMRARQEQMADGRARRNEENMEHLQAQLDREAAKRAQTASRAAQQLADYEARKAQQASLTTSRRLATMQFARLREDYQEQQHKAQVSFGPTSDDGKRQLQSILDSLTLIDAEVRSATGDSPRGISTAGGAEGGG